MSISTGFNATHRATSAEYHRHVYTSDGWSPSKVWDGRAASMSDAGIEGPSTEVDSWQPSPSTAAGSETDVGIHAFRYRYLDSSTGRVSNPSEEREVTVAAGALQLTFPISTSGVANILRSSDSKVDKIVVEMTVIGGVEFFKAGEVLESAASIVIDISDATLQEQFLPWPEDGHDPPPIARYVVSHRERLWYFGQVSHSVGNCDVTNGSADVAEGATDPDWNADVFGSSDGTSDVQWLFQRDGDAAVYEVSYYDAGNTKIVLRSTYGGVTGTDVDYRVFSRANVIWISRAGYPESFIPLKFLNGPGGDTVGDVTAGIGYGPGMVFFSLNSIHQLNWDQDPLVDPVYTPVSNQRGALGQRVVIEVEGILYAMDRLGWYSWAGVSPTHISTPVDTILADYLDFDYSDEFHAVYYPKLRAIRWFVVYSGDTLPQNYLQYDIDTGAWSTGTLDVAITAAKLVPSASGLRVVVGDENGHLWFDDEGTCDGCAAAQSHLRVGSQTTPTTTVLSVVDDDLSAITLHTTNAGLDGCMAYWLEGGENRLIASNTADSITVAAFSSAPAVGDHIWIGRIPAKLKTKAFLAAAGRRKKRRGRYLWIYFEPHASTRHCLVRFFLDGSSSAETYPTTSKNENLPGLTYPGNDSDYAESDGTYTDWVVDLSYSEGVVRVPVPSEWVRSVEVELEWIEPDSRVSVYGLVFGGEDVEALA